jgi:hypothetical protein
MGFTSSWCSPPGKPGPIVVGKLATPVANRDESHRLGNGTGDGKDSRSRCPDELFAVARVVWSGPSASASGLLTGTIFSFSVFGEAMFSARTA